jgi:hypothetical protein
LVLEDTATAVKVGYGRVGIAHETVKANEEGRSGERQNLRIFVVAQRAAEVRECFGVLPKAKYIAGG